MAASNPHDRNGHAQLRTVTPAPAPAAPGELISVHQVAQILGCSPRHVARLLEGRKIPAPRRLGTLVRWSRTEIMAWIAAGCPERAEAGEALGR